jgi:ribosomal protein L21E
MVKRKSPRTRGKISLSKYFQRFKEGDSVSIVREKSLEADFPKRIQGTTGKIKGRRGRSYVVELKDKNKLKEFIIQPIHLKKLKTITN